MTRRKILIVEDEVLVRCGLRSMVNWEKLGMDVIGDASNGKEALEIYEKEKPDIVMTDIKMPVMDGFEATRRIRTLSKTIPIIALTAFAFEREKEIAKQCEFTDYVVKPIDIKELKKLIAKVLA